MKTKNACILLLAALALTACEYDDSALWEQVNQNKNTERIAALEVWQAKTNTNIQSTQALLGTTDCITAVTPVTEAGMKVGYTITFLNSSAITIYNEENGVAGITPQIGITQEDGGNWYWTLNGDLMTDGEGDSIRANDDSAPVPQLSTGASLTVSQDSEGAAIVDDAVYLSVDEGKTWTRVSGEDGKSFFSDVDISDPTFVTFTLADGTTTFSVPRYTGIKLTFDTQAVYLDYGDTQTVNFTAEGSDQFTADNLFIIAPDGWKAEVTLHTRAATEFILNVTAPAETQVTAGTAVAEGEILVMLDNQQGSTTIGRLEVGFKCIIEGTKLTARNLEAGKLVEAIGNRTDLTSITVTSGTLNETDWAAVVKNKAALLYLDLAGATYEGTDKDNLIYNTTGATLAAISIKLPQGITTLGEKAFLGCTALTTVTLPETLTSIGYMAFASCNALTSITLPEGVTSIGTYTFYNCKGLTSIDLPEGLTSIGEFTFYNCASLTSIDLPEGLTSIGESTFNNCTSLTSITLPDGVKTIEGSTFNNCTSLTSITLPDGVKTIEEYTFASCTSLTSIDLPAGVTSIGDYAFSGCASLTSIDLPETLTSIGNFAFSSCKGLTSIDLPEGVTSIGRYAFYNCPSLTSIDLPETLTTIGDYAFQSCTSLTTITCQATGVPDLGDSAFKNCSKLANIYVPASSVNAYKAATGWSAYENIIQAIP